MAETRLSPLDRDLWVADAPLPLWIGDVGTRMTVVRTPAGLWLHSPVPLDDALRAEIDALGDVRWLVGPSLVHHLFLGDWARAYPDAELWAAPGLPEKRTDLAFLDVIRDDGPAPWADSLRHHVFGGAPRMNEVVFHHPASRTLVLTDLAFNVHPGPRNRARLFHRLVGATGRFGPHRLVRAFLRDPAAARASRDHVLRWDFDRVIVTHGDVLERGGKEAFREAFAYLG